MVFIFMSLILFFSGETKAQRFSFPYEYAQEEMLNLAQDLNVELEELKKEPYIAISLGENCFPALHLREFGIRIRSFPFDWDITPFASLYAILENDFEGFIDRKYLAINQKENTIFNTRYGFKLNHDFDIADWFDGAKGLEPRSEESMKKYQKTVSYYCRRISRFYAIFNLGVPIYLFRRVIGADQAKKLNSLLKLKFPQSNFTLVCIQDEQRDPLASWTNMPSSVVYYRLPQPLSHALGQKNSHMESILKDLGLIN